MTTTLPPGLRRSALWQSYRFATNPLALLDELEDRCGRIFTLRLVGSRPWICLSAPDHLRTMYTAPPDVLCAGEAAGSVFAPLTGWDASLNLDGNRHVQRRRMLQRPFGREKVRVYSNAVQTLAREVVLSWPVAKPFAVHPSLRHITLSVILHAVFGIAVNARRGRLAQLVERLGDRGMNSLLLVVPALRWDLGRISPWGRILTLVRETDAEIRREIVRRRAERDPGEDVLNVLLQARDEQGQPLSDGAIRDELIALLLAGYETTHTAIAWVLERLLACPEALPRLEKELFSVEDPADLDKLPFLDAVIRESLRLRPVSPICGGRVVKQPFEVGGYRLPPGVILTNCSYLLHRRSDLYSEPSAFRPERFLDTHHDPHAWTTFGGGDRRCVGYHLALLEMKVVIATALRHFRLRLERQPVRPIARGVHLLPEGGLRIIAERRFAA